MNKRSSDRESSFQRKPMWTPPIEPERDHPGVEPEHEEKVHRFDVGTLPVIKGIRIPTPVFNFDFDDFTAALDFVNSEEWSDGENSRTSTTPAMVQDSIRVIRDEASRMDSILALDKLDSLMEELLLIKKELASRKAGMDEQRDQIKLKDSRIAMLELERDLYKADNSKLKQDLKGLVAQRQDKSDLSSLTEVRTVTDSDQSVCSMSPAAHARVPGLTRDRESDGKVNRLQSQDEPGDRTTKAISPEHDYSAKVAMSPQRLARYMTAPGGATSRKVEGGRGSKTTCKSCARLLLKRVMERQSVASATTLLPPCSTDLTGSMCSCDSNASPIESHVRDLHRRLKNSMDMCEELRKRLAVASHYYESLVQRLQMRLVSVSADKERMETELIVQLSSIHMDKQRAFHLLQAKLAEKEETAGLLRSCKKLTL